jgi:hypothetical protein
MVSPRAVPPAATATPVFSATVDANRNKADFIVFVIGLLLALAFTR